ncbi:hypothetical protein [Enterobacter sp. ENT03]|uniref:hypothetical protein n=1 Tax=Enterobacter sp. ENT03 TaxID=2854780 RepID=UPI001C44A607|nr:hypothetical protein [Enterobacter sp. ENT03]MBV7405545.1 hypothetical protein [Enterobacter sp. ENT03]
MLTREFSANGGILETGEIKVYPISHFYLCFCATGGTGRRKAIKRSAISGRKTLARQDKWEFLLSTLQNQTRWSKFTLLKQINGGKPSLLPVWLKFTMKAKNKGAINYCPM